MMRANLQKHRVAQWALTAQAEIPDNVGELIKLDRLDDIAVHSECIALDNITLFTGGGKNDNGY